MSSLDQRTLKEAVDILVGAEAEGGPGVEVLDTRCSLSKMSLIVHSF